jgi:hypothetical protein
MALCGLDALRLVPRDMTHTDFSIHIKKIQVILVNISKKNKEKKIEKSILKTNYVF